jgi:hypothetical protein
MCRASIASNPYDMFLNDWHSMKSARYLVSYGLIYLSGMSFVPDAPRCSVKTQRAYLQSAPTNSVCFPVIIFTFFFYFSHYWYWYNFGCGLQVFLFMIYAICMCFFAFFYDSSPLIFTNFFLLRYLVTLGWRSSSIDRWRQLAGFHGTFEEIGGLVNSIEYKTRRGTGNSH